VKTANYLIRILVVDDDENYLASLRRIMRGHFILVTTTDPVQALKIIEYQGPFSVVISDFRMPFMNGIELFSKIVAIDHRIQRIMLTGCAELQMAIDAVNRGKITAFLTKPTPAGTIRLVVFDAIRTYNECFIGNLSTSETSNPELSTKENINGLYFPLTVKEKEILAWLAKGCSNEEISIKLNITVGTVKCHVNNLLGKMGVNSRCKAVAKANELGILKTSTVQ
jgi:DNA-binding NarL/FixJ family response regulator